MTENCSYFRSTTETLLVINESLALCWCGFCWWVRISLVVVELTVWRIWEVCLILNCPSYDKNKVKIVLPNLGLFMKRVLCIHSSNKGQNVVRTRAYEGGLQFLGHSCSFLLVKRLMSCLHNLLSSMTIPPDHGQSYEVECMCMCVHICFLTVPSSDMWWKTHALRTLYSFVYLIFSEYHVLGTVLGTGVKAVNTAKNKKIKIKLEKGLERDSEWMERKRRELEYQLRYFRWWGQRWPLRAGSNVWAVTRLNFRVSQAHSPLDLSESVSSSAKKPCLPECIWCLLTFFILILLLLFFFCI